MPFSKYSPKQKKLARVAKPRKEKMRKPGTKGAPTAAQFKAAAKTAKKPKKKGKKSGKKSS
jgi:hypothetical protein